MIERCHINSVFLFFFNNICVFYKEYSLFSLFFSMFSFSIKTSGGVGTMQSLFTNNAQVYYKPHSLAVGGPGTVVNARHKARKT
jgi:hypothetical protein